MIDLIDLYFRAYNVEIESLNEDGQHFIIRFINKESRYQFETTINRDQLETLANNCQTMAETISKELNC